MKLALAIIILISSNIVYCQCPIWNTGQVTTSLSEEEICKIDKKSIEAMKCGCRTGTVNLSSGPWDMTEQEASQLAQQINSTMDLSMCWDVRNGSRVTSCKSASKNEAREDQEESDVDTGPTDEERIERAMMGAHIAEDRLNQNTDRIDKLQSDFDAQSEIDDDHLEDFTGTAHEMKEYTPEDDINKIFSEGNTSAKAELKDLLDSMERANAKNPRQISDWQYSASPLFPEQNKITYSYLQEEEDDSWEDDCSGTSFMNEPTNFELTSRDAPLADYWVDNIKDAILKKIGASSSLRKIYGFYDDHNDAIERANQTGGNVETIFEGFFEAIEEGLNGGSSSVESWLNDKQNYINGLLDQMPGGNFFKINQIDDTYQNNDVYTEDYNGTPCDDLPYNLGSVASSFGRVLSLSQSTLTRIIKLF